jgi:outer membrane protein insertion porin family
VDATSLATGAYATDTLGGGVKFSYPLSERDTVSFGILAEDVTVETFANSPAVYKDFVAQLGSKYTYGALTAGWLRDTRDSLIVTTAGTVTRVTGEIAAGGLEYHRVNFNQQFYWPLSSTFTLLWNVDLGYARGTGGKPLPFFKNYYAGGPGTVRGYEDFSLGPRDAENNTLGGTRRVVTNLELLFPMPGASQEKSLRLGAFIDAGQVYGPTDDLDLGLMRSAVGLALAWASPMGPLRLSYAMPINEKEGIDRVQRLQFKFGAAF